MYIITSDDHLMQFKEGAPITIQKRSCDEGLDLYGWGFKAKLLSFDEALDFAIGFISSSPDFLRGDELWMIDYTKKLKSLFCNIEHHFRRLNINNLYEVFFDDLQIQGRYLAIRATRLFYLIDVIDAIFYGGSIGHFELGKNKPKYIATGVLEPLLADDDEVIGFSRSLASNMMSNSFRRYISGSCYSEYAVAIKDESLDMYEELIEQKSSGLYSAELCNFYKSSNLNKNGSFFKNLPVSKNHKLTLSSRFSFYPIITVQFNARDYRNNLLGYRGQVPLSCLVAGSSSFQIPEELNDTNFESYCDREDAEKSIRHKYKMDSENLRKLMANINGLP